MADQVYLLDDTHALSGLTTGASFAVTAASGTTLLVVLASALENISMSAYTYDGDTMPYYELAYGYGGGGYSWLWYVTPKSGSKTLSFTWSGSHYVGFTCYHFKDICVSTPVYSKTQEAGYGPNSTGPTVATISSGFYAIQAASTNYETDVGAYPMDGQTTDQQFATSISGSGVCSLFHDSVTGGSDTFRWDWQDHLGWQSWGSVVYLLRSELRVKETTDVRRPVMNSDVWNQRRAGIGY